MSLRYCMPSNRMPSTAAYAFSRASATVVSGGRVLCVTALGNTVADAREKAYAAVDGIRFDGMQYRKDIGHRAL